MRRQPLAAVLLLGALLALGACKEEVAQDLTPRDLTVESVGHYCQMDLLDHPGPKAQVHLEGAEGAPLFFSQVRDAIAYARGPEQMAPILAIYVNDMGRPGIDWDDPGHGNWIDADSAFYVAGSDRLGGMGATETIPFANRDGAEAFANAEGGRVLTLAEISDDMVFAPAAGSPDVEAEDDDYLERLRALARPAGG